MSMPIDRRIRLSAMMFLQYAIHAVWFMQLAEYVRGSLSGTPSQIAWVASTAALGAILAPIFVGMIADRFFASEKVLALLNLASGALLFWASTITSPWLLFGVLLVQMLCYMPTWAITNNIAIANCEDTEKDLPSIRVFGSVGWVATALFGLICAKELNLFGLATVTMLDIPWDATAKPMVAAAVLSVVAGLFAFVLPHTAPPAAGKKASVSDVLGLKALALMKRPSFAIFIIVSLLVMLPFALYWTFFSVYLASLGVSLMTATMHLGQFIEIFVMWLLLPIALKKLGVKWTLVAGVAILGLRYLMFMFGDASMALNYGGIFVHGFIFSFFFVTGYIYSDQVAPKEIRAQAQALIMLVTFGAGMLLGNYISGRIVAANAVVGEPAKGFKVPAAIGAIPTLAGLEGAKVSDTVVYNRRLNDKEFALLIAQQRKDDVLVKRLRDEFGDEADLDKGKLAIPGPVEKLTFATWVELPEDKTELTGTILKVGQGDKALALGLDKGRLTAKAGKAVMTYASPLPAGKKVHVAVSFDGETLRLYTQGKAFTRYAWRTIWTWPAIISAVLMVAMILFFHVPKKEAEAEEAPAEEEPPAEAAEGGEEAVADEGTAE